MNQQDFISTYGPIAQDVAKATGLDASIVLGHMAQETGWGEHVAGNGTNLFGVSMPGTSTPATYPTLQDGAHAYVDLINRRYAPAAQQPTPDAQATALQELGYNRTAGYGAAVSARANTVRQLGFGAPTVDDIKNMLPQTSTTAPATSTPDTSGAPSVDDIKNMLPTMTITPQSSTPAETPPKPTYSQAGTITPTNAMTPGPSTVTPTVQPTTGQQLAAVPGNMLSAATQGYNDTNLLTPQVQASLDQNHPVIGTITRDLSGVLGVGNAAYKGLQAGVATVGNAVSPGLGNDLATGMDILPVARFLTPEGALVGAVKPAVAAQMADNRLANAAPLSPDFRASPTANGLNVARVTPQGDTSINPNVPAGRPAAAGADVTSEPIPAYTPAQRATVERTQLFQTAADRNLNGKDTTDYVPGVQPLHSSVEPTVSNAVGEKTLIATDPVFAQKVSDINKANNDARFDHYNNVSGDPNAVAQSVEARTAQVQANRQAVFSNAKPIDAQPVVDAIDQALAGPAGKRSAVAAALQQARDALYTGKNLDTDATLLDGARQSIGDMLSKVGQQADPKMMLATGELTKIKNLLVNQIEQGAPGYTQYLQDFADASKPIDAMKLLQGYLPKLVDAQGVMQSTRVQNMLKDIVAQRAAPGINKAKALSDDQMQQLFNLRNDLARDAYKDNLARVKGSDTTQQLNAANRLGSGAIGTTLKAVGDLAAHSLIQTVAPGGAANFTYMTARNALAANKAVKAAAQAAAERQALMDKLSAPHPEYGIPPQ